MFFWHLQAGPGTIAEALIRGLPIILNDFIPGQVSVPLSVVSVYIVEFSASLYSSTTHQLAASLIWFTEPKQRYYEAR